MGARILNAMDGYLRYCGHVFWPTDLAAIYTFSGRTATETALAGLLVIVVTFVAVWRRKRQPYLLVGWGWYPGDTRAGHRTGAGRQPDHSRSLHLLARHRFVHHSRLGRRGAYRHDGRGADWSSSRRRRQLLPPAPLSARAQLVYWQDSQLLFRHALKANKDNYVAWSGLGYYLAEQGQPRQAEACYRTAVAINPSFAEAWNGLGYTLGRLETV